METVVIEVRSDYRDNMSSGLNASRQNVDRFTESVDRSRERMRQLGSQNARPTVGLIDRASSALTRINSGLRSFAGKTWRTSVKIVDYATRPLRAIKNTLFSIKGLVMAIGAGWAAKKVFMDPIGLADSYSSAKIGFSTLLGDKQGQKMMNDLDAFAKKTPFKTSNTIAQAQKLVAMGWDAKNIVKDMYTIGDAAAATGKGDEGLQRISLALSQIKSKGKLSTEELNQLAEAGISAKRYIAEGLGYGSGDSALAKMSKDLEGGKIMADEAIQAILKGMKEYKGMMNKTANETVEGLKSQIEDTFEINVLRKWGQGLQDGAKKGFGSIVKFLDANEERLSKFGDTLKEIGKTLSNWAANKLESTLDKLMKLTERSDFKKASLFGKVKIAWDELISKPFGAWWDSSGKAKIMEKLTNIGQGMGSGTSSILKGLFGLSDSDSGIIGEATTLGGSFAQGFSKGFDGKGVADAFGRAFKKGIKALFSGNWLSRIILGYITLNVTSGVLSGLSTVKNFLVGSGTGGAGLSGAGGLIGAIGSASTASGTLVGTGAIGGLAKLGAAATGHGGLLSITPYTGGGLALAGTGTALGIAGGIAGGVNALGDYMSYRNSNTSNDKKLYGTRAATKAGMVGTGALIGTIIAPGIGTAIGAGVGGLATFLAGNKLADSISGVSKSTAELNEEAAELDAKIEKLAAKDMKKRFGEWSLSADELSRKVKKIVGEDTIRRVNKFNQSMTDLSEVQETLADNKYTIDYSSAMIKGGGKLSKSDISEYKSALKQYASSTKELLITNKKSTRSAFALLYGDDTKGMAKMTKDMEKTYSGLEKKLAKKSAKLNDVIADAFEDGKITIDEQKKIDEIVGQIEDIQDKVQERIEKISKAESDAAYDLIKQKYTYSDLTPESFKTLIGELNAQNEVDLKGYDDAYIKAKAEIDVEFEEGNLTKEKYEDKLDEIKEKWLKGKENTIKASVEVSLDVVKTNYNDKFNNLSDALSGDNLKLAASNLKTHTTFNANGLEYMHWDKKESKKYLDELQDSFLKEAGVSKKVQKEMASLYESLKPQEEDLKELKKAYEDAGDKVPQWIEDSLADIENIKLMSGDKSSFYTLIGEQLAKQDPSHAKKLLKEKGALLPKAFKNGIEEGLKEVESETEAIEMNTNLKLTADKKNIDTSDLDEKTKSVIESLKDNDILTIDKEGQVKIKTKDGKIDTTGLDDDTKKAVEELEEKGIIVVKDGKVKVNAKEIDTKDAEKKSEKKTKKDLGKGTKTDKNVDVKVKDKTKTGAAKKNSDKKSKKDLGKGTKTDKKVNVNVKDNTKTASAKKNSEKKIKSDLKGPVSANTRTNVNASFGGFNGTLSRLKSTVFNKIKSDLASTNVTTLVNIKARRFGGPTSDQSGEGHNAYGSRVDREMLTWVGENNNREYIIPVTAGKRQRGIDLWKQAGKDLGIMNNADGGVYGGSSIRRLLTENSGDDSVSNAETEQKSNRTGNKVEVNVGGITIEISGNGDASDIRNNKDEICNTIAEALQEAFQNLPLATT